MKWVRICGGTLLLLIGLTGLILPIMPGWIFIAPGLLLLSADVPPIRRRLRYLERRYPWLRQMLDKLRRRKSAGRSE